jgi:putative transposase
MEERRLQAGRLLRKRWSEAEIARQLGVSRTAVSRWAQRMARGGWRQLRRRKRNGRPPKLGQEQLKLLRRHLKRGAKALGFRSDRWTLQRIQKVIEREFQVVYHPNYVARVLDKMGWSPQVPLPRAKERDEALIRAWLAKDWPRIKKGSAERRHDRIFR